MSLFMDIHQHVPGLTRQAVAERTCQGSRSSEKI